MAEEEIRETEEETQQSVEPDVLGMSDEDMLKMSPEEFIIPKEKSESDDEVEGSESESELEPEEQETESKPAREAIYEQESEESESEEDEVEPEEVEAKKADTEGYETDGKDYKKLYESLLAPFKASGREVTVKSEDDARRLMQMGVDYQKKMHALKPHLRIMKALEKNKLLDEEKINFFIDLENKNPDAIARFMKDKGVDPLEVDLEIGENYKPKSHAPSEKEMDLDEVLDSIRETPSFQKTIDELGSKWDSESRTVLMDNPSVIRMLNEHMGAGIYDQIMSVVDSERLMGRLQGMHDLAAYKTVGDALQAKGAFSQLAGKPEVQRKPVQDPKRKARKKAAGLTKRTTAKKGLSPDFNPLAMSDDDFDKVAISTYLQ